MAESNTGDFNIPSDRSSPVQDAHGSDSHPNIGSQPSTFSGSVNDFNTLYLGNSALLTSGDQGVNVSNSYGTEWSGTFTGDNSMANSEAFDIIGHQPPANSGAPEQPFWYTDSDGNAIFPESAGGHGIELESSVGGVRATQREHSVYPHVHDSAQRRHGIDASVAMALTRSPDGHNTSHASLSFPTYTSTSAVDFPSPHNHVLSSIPQQPPLGRAEVELARQRLHAAPSASVQVYQASSPIMTQPELTDHTHVTVDGTSTASTQDHPTDHASASAAQEQAQDHNASASLTQDQEQGDASASASQGQAQNNDEEVDLSNASGLTYALNNALTKTLGKKPRKTFVLVRMTLDDLNQLNEGRGQTPDGPAAFKSATVGELVNAMLNPNEDAAQTAAKKKGGRSKNGPHSYRALPLGSPENRPWLPGVSPSAPPPEGNRLYPTRSHHVADYPRTFYLPPAADDAPIPTPNEHAFSRHQSHDLMWLRGYFGMHPFVMSAERIAWLAGLDRSAVSHAEDYYLERHLGGKQSVTHRRYKFEHRGRRSDNMGTEKNRIGSLDPPTGWSPPNTLFRSVGRPIWTKAHLDRVRGHFDKMIADFNGNATTTIGQPPAGVGPIVSDPNAVAPHTGPLLSRIPDIDGPECTTRQPKKGKDPTAGMDAEADKDDDADTAAAKKTKTRAKAPRPRTTTERKRKAAEMAQAQAESSQDAANDGEPQAKRPRTANAAPSQNQAPVAIDPALGGHFQYSQQSTGALMPPQGITHVQQAQGTMYSPSHAYGQPARHYFQSPVVQSQVYHPHTSVPMNQQQPFVAPSGSLGGVVRSREEYDQAMQAMSHGQYAQQQESSRGQHSQQAALQPSPSAAKPAKPATKRRGRPAKKG